MGKDIPNEFITNIKTSLMGPLAGVGDTIWQGVLIPILLALCIDVTLSGGGNIWGAVVYGILMFLITYIFSYANFMFGYHAGSDAIMDFLEKGILNKLLKGASIMGSECGIPASKAGLKFAQDAGAVKSLVAEANAKVMAFTTNKLDPLFEHNDLKASGTGIYQEVFDNIDYGDQTPEEAVEILLDGMESVGYTIG